MIEDVPSDPRFARDVAERTGYVPKGLMAVPLLHEERALGVLEVLDRPQDARFTLAEMDLLGLFANQAAIALDLLQRRAARRSRARVGKGELAVVARLAAAVARSRTSSARPACASSASSPTRSATSSQRPVGGNDERKAGNAEEVRQEHHRDQQEVQGIHGRGTSRDEGARPGAEGGSAREQGQGGGESAVLAKIAEMPEPDRAMAERLHAIIKASAPDLSPKTWYGMPAYARDGKVVCFFQSAQKFNSRYATFGFSDEANLDEGAMWPTSFALKELTAADEARIGALVKKAVSS